jgi:hypothetical protein
MALLEVQDVVRLLRKEVHLAGGQTPWARKNGIDRAGLNKVLNGHIDPTTNIIAALNLRTIYTSEARPRNPSGRESNKSGTGINSALEFKTFPYAARLLLAFAKLPNNTLHHAFVTLIEATEVKKKKQVRRFVSPAAE